MNEVTKLKRSLRLQWLIILALAIYVFVGDQMPDESPEIIHAKGIVLEDDAGNDRIVMGFPIPTTDDRERTDPLSGIVMLSEDGKDRIHLGQNGKLFLGGTLYNRTITGYSLFFNDTNGEERSGYGFSDNDNSVGLGMDYPGEDGGEAIFLYAAPKMAFMTLNADLPENSGIRDRIVLWHETDEDLSIVKLSDSQKDGEIILRTQRGKTEILNETEDQD